MNAIQPEVMVYVPPDIAFAGNCGYTIENDRAIINIAEIASHRPFDDLSGTLAIELWAVKQPATDTLDGHLLASTTIGELSGQYFLADCRYDLIFQEPPAGSWQLTLVLREWTAEGYVTRDQIGFPLPYVVASKPMIVRSETDNVISVKFVTPKDIEVKVAIPASTPSVPSNPVKVPVCTTVSLNEASVGDIEAVKGVSKKLAKNIVASRPFTSFDEVLKVKGMGTKLLQKIREYITL